MDTKGIFTLIKNGEGIETEFKSSYFELNKNVYESICAFLNTKGGHLLLGVQDNGVVSGVLPAAVDTIMYNLVVSVNNSQILHPPFYLSPVEFRIENKTIIYVYVPESSQVHNNKGKVFVRNDDGDLNITQNHKLISELYIRKQNTFSENQIYPEVHLYDFKNDLFARTRKLVRNINSNHPWIEMTDFEILKSAGLHKKDYTTGREGYTLAAILLFGHDQVIQSILPHYKTDALLRIHNKDRYDDRLDIRTNLIESYDLLLDFIKKHLPDKFYLEHDQRKSLVDIIFREIASNIMIHREFTNPFPAKLIIKEDQVYTENWNRPHIIGTINPDNFTPYPKNPIIARFFKEIGRVDELGSGVRNTFKYVSIYSNGKTPVFHENDVFSISIPLPEEMHVGEEKAESDTPTDTLTDTTTDTLADAVNNAIEHGSLKQYTKGVKTRLVEILKIIQKEQKVTSETLAGRLKKSIPTIKRDLSALKKAGIIDFKGSSSKTGSYYIKERIQSKINSTKPTKE